jgi:uncharacterized SAM-binding protein YcdF (DUF218 family)
MKINVTTLLNKILKSTFISLGVIFFIMILLSFTSLPFWMYYHLGVSHTSFEENPDYIAVLGGGGIPSESGLMRTYKTSQVSKKYPDANIIIALPGDISDSTSSINLMRHDVITRGVDSLKIILEPFGLNTRMQALQISKLISLNSNILIITSPEHMYRATQAFKKAGMKNTQGESAFEYAIESALLYDDDKLGGNNYIIDIGDNTQLRYQFWNHFKYQIIVYREYCAIAYYKLKGWI